jgi:hypothetical protein
MKARKSFLKSTLLLAMATVSVFTFSACNDDDDDMDYRSYNITGTANGGQMVPSVSGTGSGNITGTYNPSSRQLNYTTTWTGMTGGPTTAGFYNGAPGVNGAAMGSSWTLGTTTSNGSYTGTMTLTDEQASQLTSGNWYYTMGTAANSTGEIRGQVNATR